MEGGPPIFEQDFTCPALLDTYLKDVAYGAVTHIAQLSRWFSYLIDLGWSAFARRY